MVEEVKQSSAKLDRLKAIEDQMRQEALDQKVYDAAPTENYESMDHETAQAGKYMATFPFPYMNGYLHLGHGFSMSKAEFQIRFQKQIGKNVFFPFAFHCTGMPIQAAANRLKKEIENGNTRSVQPTKEEIAAAKKAKKDPPSVPFTQYEILMQLGIAEEEIPKFIDSNYWLDFFPPKGLETLYKFGIHADWRRSFITTERNPYFDSFIRWQFHHLKEMGKIKFGKRYTIFSEQDGQPCADHDRAKGEGVLPQEYTAIKIKLLELPESLAQFEGRNIFMVAATLRPETMYGQTNCFVLPEGVYGVFEMQNDELFIMSKRAARGMAYQDLTKEEKKYPQIVQIQGQELIGKKVKAPLSKFEFVYVLPLPSISMVKGTGIVTSVPSDSPADYSMMNDLQTKKGLREKLNIEEEWVKGFDPIPIISCPTLGDICAKTACEEFKIQSHKDVDKIELAKNKCYQEGFDHGVMTVGICEGQKVQDCKPIVKQHMIDEGMACPYYEPTSEVVARSGDQCIVAACDQWLLNYGEESWRETLKEYVSQDSFECYNPKTKHEFMKTLDWLKEWGCSRTQGLGTFIPWDKQFVIESLSDSTIYMAYYSISHMLQGGKLDGTEMGPAKVPASAMTLAAYDYIFHDKPYNAEECPDVSEETLAKMRYEYKYWYPANLRVSGKDLIRNHLTFSLYNHEAVLGIEKTTRGYFCNGYLMINGDKMSKSTGNFLTMDQSMDKYGVEATKIALADSGDGLDDANFDGTVANSAILKLFVLEQWIKEHVPADGFDFATFDSNTLTGWDKIVMNECKSVAKEAREAYATMKLKNVIKLFNQFTSLKESYAIATDGNTNPGVIAKYIETLLTMMNPIIPFFCQYQWQTYMVPFFEKCQNVPKAPAARLDRNGWVQFDNDEVDPVMSASLSYVEKIKHSIRQSFEKAQQGGGKKKGKKGKGAAEPEEKKVLANAVIFIGTKFPDFQVQVLELLQSCTYDENNKIVDNEHIGKVRAAITDKKAQGLAMKFAAFVLDDVAVSGPEKALQLRVPFDEAELLEANKKYLFENMHTIQNIRIILNSDEEVIKGIEGAEQIASSATPGKPMTMFF